MHSKDKYTAHAVPPERIQIIQVQLCARNVLLASIQVLLVLPIARTVLLASIQVLPAQPVLPIARTVMLASFPVLAQPAARTVLQTSQSGQAARPVLLARSQFLTVRPGQTMTGVIIQIQHWQHKMQHWRQVQRRFPPTWTVFQLSGRNMRTKTAGMNTPTGRVFNPGKAQ